MSNIVVPSRCTFKTDNTSTVLIALNDVSHAEWQGKCLTQPKPIFPDVTTTCGVFEGEAVNADCVAMAVYRFNSTSLLLLLASFNGGSPATKMAIISAIGPVINSDLVKGIWNNTTYTSELPIFTIGSEMITGSSSFENLSGVQEASFSIHRLWPVGSGPNTAPARSATCDFDVDNQSIAGFTPFTTSNAEWLGTCTTVPQDIKPSAESSAGNYATAEYGASTIAMAVYHVGDDTGNDKLLLLLAKFGGNEAGATKMTIRQNEGSIIINPKFVMSVWNDPRVTATLGPVDVPDVPAGERIAGTSSFRQLENGASAADFVLRPCLLSLDNFVLPPICGFKVTNPTNVNIGVYANSSAVYLGKCLTAPTPILPTGTSPAGFFECTSKLLIHDTIAPCVAMAVYSLIDTKQLLLLLVSFPSNTPSAKIAILPAAGQVIGAELAQQVWDDPKWTDTMGPFDASGSLVAMSSSVEKLVGAQEATFELMYVPIDKK